MSTDQRIRIELTPEQKHQVKEASGKEMAVIEFTINELEQRIAPSKSVIQLNSWSWQP